MTLPCELRDSCESVRVAFSLQTFGASTTCELVVLGHTASPFARFSSRLYLLGEEYIWNGTCRSWRPGSSPSHLESILLAIVKRA